ncbi:hypothetical protein DFJ58DRAFT_782174 [Suillus subalutaceus]|uniref:uncharacterized protein n=1 Tax=Suillus subalutaceus TaxID=48586 RepID=UPI001B85B918|nr:uncharacterized protein DFJ58DRAFT_782174 [Suillus subalutaceus]KAG1858422.1 hypothetical protein DFJ58DRAFT_782174 [Suillus subalutaceus]
MARVSFQPTPPARFASTLAKRWGPTLGIWGLLSVTPVVKKGFLVNIPLVRFYVIMYIHPAHCSNLARDGYNFRLGITTRTKHLLRTSRSECPAIIDTYRPLKYHYFI